MHAGIVGPAWTSCNVRLKLCVITEQQDYFMNGLTGTKLVGQVASLLESFPACQPVTPAERSQETRLLSGRLSQVTAGDPLKGLYG